jgi:hypothetical protein
MAVMQALLKIKADVTGEGAVQGLASKIGGLGNAASKVQGGIKGLAGAAGGLGGALGALVPAVSVAGMAALAKGAIDTADNFAKMSAKTGASVEQLSKFKQAADLGGSSIEEVGNSMLKLNRALGTGEGPAIEALKTLGINANNANGKLKSTDAIMLEVADKFKAMPDGANKSALAMDLFGKSGANMIPMLNGGSKAIDGLNATMTTKFAKAAEVFNDRITTIQAKLMELGVQLADVLMPVFNGLMSLIETIVSAIGGLPGPIQAIILSVVALTAALVILAPAISAIISIAGVLAGLKIGATIAGWAALAGPAITAISAAFSGLLAFLTGTLLPGLLAFFSGPVGWTVLAVAAVVAMVVLFRKPLTDFAAWLWEWGKPISSFWAGLWNGLVNVVNTAATTIKSVFTGVGTAIKAVLNGVLRGVFGAVNGAIGNINRLINAANNLSARVKGPQLPTLPTLSVPQFAQGGVVTGPTLAMVGEGGEPEYIIPSSKMAAASANYLNGARGGAVIPAFANGGFVGGNAQINVTTGPVMQQGGQQYVSMADLERAMRKTADGIYSSLRTPAGRYAVGTR